MRVYKLTDSDGYTRKGQDGETKWEVGVRHELPHTDDPQLCSSDVFHAYGTIVEAGLFDPLYSGYGSSAILWECETTSIVVDDGVKIGVFDLTPIRQIELPLLTIEERLEIAIKLELLTGNNVTDYKYETSEEDKVIKSLLVIKLAIEKIAGWSEWI